MKSQFQLEVSFDRLRFSEEMYVKPRLEAPSSQVQSKPIVDPLEVASHRYGENDPKMERGLPVNVPLNDDQQAEVENYSTDHGQVQTATYDAMI